MTQDLTKDLYRSVFGTPNGIRVLTHLLTEMSFFTPYPNEKEQILSNYAKRILENCGIYRDNSDDLESLITAMFNIPFKD
jgi:hypothetical protein